MDSCFMVRWYELTLAPSPAWAGWSGPPPDCPRNVEGTFSPSGLIRSQDPAKYFIAFLLLKFISSAFFLEISGIWSKDFWGQNCTFWGIENAKIPSFGFRTRFNPFLRDLVLSSCCMIRGAARMRKCWFYPKMIVVRWRMIVGHDDWPEFQAAEWWRSVCAVMTENDPCVWYCKGLGDAFIDGNILISVKPAELKAWKILLLPN